LSFFKKINSG